MMPDSRHQGSDPEPAEPFGETTEFICSDVCSAFQIKQAL